MKLFSEFILFFVNLPVSMTKKIKLIGGIYSVFEIKFLPDIENKPNKQPNTIIIQVFSFEWNFLWIFFLYFYYYYYFVCVCVFMPSLLLWRRKKNEKKMKRDLSNKLTGIKSFEWEWNTE